MTPKILEKEIDSELMLYDSERDEVHVLNATARRIYEMSREGRSPAEIEQTIRAGFGPGMQQAVHKDVQECIEDLSRKGLLTSTGD